MKKLLLVLSFALLVSSCGVNQDGLNETEKGSENKVVNNTETEQTEEFVDFEVELIFSPITMEENFNIEEYVKNLNAEDNENYYVYDDSHYAKKIKESERLEFLRNFDDSEKVSEEITSQLNKNYPEVFKKVVLENKGKDVSVYVSKELYENSDFAVTLNAIIIPGVFSSNLQTYNLVPISERSYSVKIIDVDTNEIIYQQ